MKQLLIAFLCLYTVSSFAQVDSSKLPISLVLKQKHMEYMGAVMSTTSSIADAHFRDSLIKYMGSGNNPDSLVNVHFTAGTVLRFIQNLLSEQANTSYSAVYEVGNGGSGGFTGILAQLFLKAATVNVEQGVSKWLFVQINNSLVAGQNVYTEKLNTGKAWLQIPIIYN